MTNLTYRLVKDGDFGNVVAYFPDEENSIRTADSNHPHWKAIVTGLVADDASVYELFDVREGAARRLTALSDRVSYDGRNILFDGDVVSGPLADQIVRCLEQGVDDYKALVAFWEKIAQNPSENSRKALFTWLEAGDFTVTLDGDIVGYKGVHKIDGPNEYQSVNAGVAYVDGVQKMGRIPNKPGTVVTMPRAQVNDDPNVHCHTGLHVGTWSYASGFAGTVLEVHVNPRDVVSVPNDAGCRKMRVCRYQVVQILGEPYASPILEPAEDVWEPDVSYAG